MPNFGCHGDALRTLAATFDELCKRELLPLSQSDNCPVRRAIDAAVCNVLGIGEDLVLSIRQLISDEPLVTSQSDEAQDSPQGNDQQMSLL